MSRLAIAIILLLSVSQAWGQRVIQFNGSTNGTPPTDVIEGTFYIGTAPLGSTTVQTLLVAPVPPVTNNDGSELSQMMRDLTMPEQGIPGIGKRSSLRGIWVFHPDDIQFWVSDDEVNWQLMSEGPVGFNFPHVGGETFFYF